RSRPSPCCSTSSRAHRRAASMDPRPQSAPSSPFRWWCWASSSRSISSRDSASARSASRRQGQAAPQGNHVAAIKLKNLEKSFGGFTAVDGINLDVRDGEFLIMVGPSGCGKTTTLNMISGLETPTNGEIVIGDAVVNDLDPGERDLGMVFQDLALFPHMTVFENIAFGLRVRKVAAEQIRERVTAAAEAMHITPLLGKMPRQCSGGESQRVALARTIVTNPSVFLMDEPLSSL